MSTYRTVIGLVLGGVVLVGCKKEEVKPPAPPTPSAGPTAPTPPAPVTTTTPGAPAIPTLNSPALPTTLPTLPPEPGPVTTTTPALPTPPAIPGTATPAATPGTGTSSSAADAKNLLADAAQNVAAKKWDAAGDDFKKLNAMRSQLSPELKDEITAAEAKFVAAKAGSGLNIPGLGGGSSDTPPNK